ncbi:MAG: LLM class flavin-dependent oxidoreductase [Dehalococcoidia bacterium]
MQTEPRPNVPVFVAALGPRMCRLAGELADGVMLNWATPAYVAEALANVRLGAERAGRDPASIEVTCYLRGRRRPAPRWWRATPSPGELARATIHMPFYRAMFEASASPVSRRRWPPPTPPTPTRRRRAGRHARRPHRDRRRRCGPRPTGQYRTMGVTLPVVAAPSAMTRPPPGAP